MKKLMTLTLCAGLLLTFIGAFAAAPATTAAPAAPATVTVNASCEIDVKPDVAYVTLGVTTEDKESKVAQKENAAKIAKVQDAIIKAGVDKKQIQTNNLSVYPKYDYSKGEKITGYTVSNSLKITLYDLDNVGSIVNIALDAGANTLQNVMYDLKNSDAVYSKVLVQAVQNAKVKAGTMAAASGKTLGEVVSLEEGSNNYSPYYSDVRVTNYSPKADAPAAAEGGVGDSIQAGNITVTAHVKGTYEIK